jgi:hypothetical protein
MAQASVAIAIMRNTIWITRCIATALTPATGLDRRAQRPRFCVSIITLINRCFCRLNVPIFGPFNRPAPTATGARASRRQRTY